MTEYNAESHPLLEHGFAESLPIFSAVEAIRHRPRMFIGDVGIPGLHHLFKEIIDNSINEVLAGYCDRITVTLGKDRSLAVEDNGRAIPVNVNEQTGMTSVELVMAEYHSGVASGNRGCRNLDSSHGVGAPCVNALSEWMETTVRCGGKIHRMRFARGIPVSPLEVIGDCASEEYGMTQRWLADRDIFKDALTDAGELDYRPERLSARMREIAFLNREVSITFIDALHDAAPVVFHYPEGIAAYVAHLNQHEEVLHAPIYLEVHHGDTQIMVALQYKRRDLETIDSFVNNWRLTEGGAHIAGFKAALTRVTNQYARQNGILTGENDNFRGEDVRAGITAIISVRMTNPMLYTADKGRLDNPELEGIVNSAIGKQLTAYFEANPEVARAIIGRLENN